MNSGCSVLERFINLSGFGISMLRMIDEEHARKARAWLRGFLRARYGDAVQVAETENGTRLVARPQDSEIDLKALGKSLPTEIVASLGSISTSARRV